MAAKIIARTLTPKQPAPRIFNWSLKRSGAAMTLEGKDAAGRPFRAAGIHCVKAGVPPIAVDQAGRQFGLGV